MGAIDISPLGLTAAFALLTIPLLINHYFKMRMGKLTLTAIARMSIQLLLVGIFLEYIFALNLWWLNMLWLLLMVATAIFSAIRSAKINFSALFLPITFAFALPTIVILLYFNAVVINLKFLFEARYLIALGGMLLGNVLSVNIVAVNSFYESLRSKQKFYLYRLGMGATTREAIAPFLRASFQLSLTPALAKTATIGIVSLPGMMTGQILGGSSPATAIKYQIAIMIAIYVTAALSALLTLIFSARKNINRCGIIDEGIYKN